MSDAMIAFLTGFVKALVTIVAVAVWGLIICIAVVGICVWLYAGYKLITRKRWHGKTPKGNHRI